VHCDYLFKLHISKFSYLLTYCMRSTHAMIKYELNYTKLNYINKHGHSVFRPGTYLISLFNLTLFFLFLLGQTVFKKILMLCSFKSDRDEMFLEWIPC